MTTDEVFKISAKHITDWVTMDSSFMKSKKWLQHMGGAKRVISFLDPVEAIALDCIIEDGGTILVFGNHDWFSIYFFLRAFIMEKKGKALGFRNFFSIEAAWVNDPVMSRILARRLMEKAESRKDSQGLVWL